MSNAATTDAATRIREEGCVLDTEAFAAIDLERLESTFALAGTTIEGHLGPRLGIMNDFVLLDPEARRNPLLRITALASPRFAEPKAFVDASITMLMLPLKDLDLHSLNWSSIFDLPDAPVALVSISAAVCMGVKFPERSNVLAAFLTHDCRLRVAYVATLDKKALSVVWADFESLEELITKAPECAAVLFGRKKDTGDLGSDELADVVASGAVPRSHLRSEAGDMDCPLLDVRSLLRGKALAELVEEHKVDPKEGTIVATRHELQSDPRPWRIFTSLGRVLLRPDDGDLERLRFRD